MPLYTLAGTPVDFPHAAYGTQLVLMAKVVTAADAGAHALLEAPTGSGKTLALLCAALAWQAKEKARLMVVADEGSGCVGWGEGEGGAARARARRRGGGRGGGGGGGGAGGGRRGGGGGGRPPPGTRASR